MCMCSRGLVVIDGPYFACARICNVQFCNRSIGIVITGTSTRYSIKDFACSFFFKDPQLGNSHHTILLTSIWLRTKLN